MGNNNTMLCGNLWGRLVGLTTSPLSIYRSTYVKGNRSSRPTVPALRGIWRGLTDLTLQNGHVFTELMLHKGVQWEDVKEGIDSLPLPVTSLTVVPACYVEGLPTMKVILVEFAIDGVETTMPLTVFHWGRNLLCRASLVQYPNELVDWMNREM